MTHTRIGLELNVPKPNRNAFSMSGLSKLIDYAPATTRTQRIPQNKSEPDQIDPFFKSNATQLIMAEVHFTSPLTGYRSPRSSQSWSWSRIESTSFIFGRNLGSIERHWTTRLPSIFAELEEYWPWILESMILQILPFLR